MDIKAPKIVKLERSFERLSSYGENGLQMDIKATGSSNSELRSCVKVEVAVLSSPSLTIRGLCELYVEH